MNKIIIALSFIAFLLNSCVEDYTSKSYLKQVLKELEKIESATYWVELEAWNPDDTVAAYIVSQYVESYRNPSDTIIGSSWADFETEQKAHLEFAYDGKMRAVIYDDVKIIVIDSFNVRILPFRPMLPPFYYYTESIIQYILENNDSTFLEQKDLGEEIYVKLIICEDRQVEFFGKAHFIPENPYTSDPTSIYELWINKKSNLPRKVRREMSHSISSSSVSDIEFNKLRIENFVASDYFQKDYKIKQYGQKENERQPNALIGKKASKWALQNYNKQDVALADLKSKVLMLQFTSVSCGPCKSSIPFLKELSLEYNKDVFDFVAIECTSNNTNVLKAYKSRNNFDYKFLLSTEEVLKEYSITSFPVFFLLDENRNIINVINGYTPEITDKEIRALINNLI